MRSVHYIPSPLPPFHCQLAGNHGSLFEGYWHQLDMNRNGRIDASSAAAFLKKSQLGDPVLHKVCLCVPRLMFIHVCVSKYP